MVEQQLRSILMSIIVNSRSIFCLSWKNAQAHWQLKTNKEIDNNDKCQQVYKFHRKLIKIIYD